MTGMQPKNVSLSVGNGLRIRALWSEDAALGGGGHERGVSAIAVGCTTGRARFGGPRDRLYCGGVRSVVSAFTKRDRTESAVDPPFGSRYRTANEMA